MKKMMLLVLVVCFGVMLLTGFSCSESTAHPASPMEVSFNFTTPVEMDTVSGLLILRAEADPTPTCVFFEFDTFTIQEDSTYPFSASFDISEYADSQFYAFASAYWADTTLADDVKFFIKELFCDPSEPVVLNGDTIPETKISRNSSGCVTLINLYEMGITAPNCLNGIEEYSASLITLYISHNDLDSVDLEPLSFCPFLGHFSITNTNLKTIDLSPLSYCENLEILGISHNDLENVDLSPLASNTVLQHLDIGYNELDCISLEPLNSCISLLYMRLSHNNLVNIDLTPVWPFDISLLMEGNPFDSTACAHICAFAADHPERNIQSDCDCAR